MTQIADLHTHSTASDGQYSPSKLLSLAKEQGVQTLALTDHDTLQGLDEAAITAKEIGIHFIRGIELGASEYRSLHLLGYSFSDSAPSLALLCKKLQDSREQRKYRIIDFLRSKHIDISLKEVEELSGTGVVGRPHFAQIMLRHGYVSTIREAFDHYLDTDEFQSIERYKANATECIATVKKNGGKVSLAHPYQLNLSNEKLEALVRSLALSGLDAIECFYPQHSIAQTEFYLSLAKRYNLHITGGSDFHGEKVKPDILLKGYPLDISWLI